VFCLKYSIFSSDVFKNNWKYSILTSRMQLIYSIHNKKGIWRPPIFVLHGQIYCQTLPTSIRHTKPVFSNKDMPCIQVAYLISLLFQIEYRFSFFIKKKILISKIRAFFQPQMLVRNRIKHIIVKTIHSLLRSECIVTMCW